MNKKIAIRNITFSLILQVFTIINGFIIPKIILSFFGSEINGLVTSISQFLNYITVLEGGISAVIMSALYKPLANKDYESVSSVIATAKSFFKKIAIIYLIYALILMIIGPVLIWPEYSWLFTSMLIMVISLNLFIQYYFSISFKILLNADRRVDIVSITQIVFIIVNLIFTCVAINVFPQIHVIKLLSIIAYAIQPIVYNMYIKKHYSLNYNAEVKDEVLKKRWDGFGQNIAYVVNINTDITVLTIFKDLSSVSIYSVYNLVATALKNLVNAISSAIIPSIGNVLVRNDIKKNNDVFDIFEFIVGTITVLLFTCGAILITDFILVYTSNIKDTNYNQPLFGYLLMISMIIGCITDIYTNVTNATGHFKQTAIYAYIQAALNIVITILLVFKVGIVGVAIGTLLATIIRYFLQINHLSKNILYRKKIKSFKLLLYTIIVFTVCNILLKFLIKIEVNDMKTWIINAFLTVIIVSFITSLISLILYRKTIKELFKRRKVNDT